MKETPILFSAPMVRAILDGRKTQTRRVVNAARGEQAEWFTPELLNSSPSAQMYPGGAQFEHPRGGSLGAITCPYGRSGDRLWVRENFWYDTREPNECVIYSEDEDKFKYRTGDRGVQSRRDRANRMPFVGDEPTAQISQNKFWKQKPSIFMPRWASRITLEITGVRVERVASISESDAIDEGVLTLDVKAHGPAEESGKPPIGASPSQKFRMLWDLLNAERGFGWDANPWVWVVEFKRI